MLHQAVGAHVDVAFASLVALIDPGSGGEQAVSSVSSEVQSELFQTMEVPLSAQVVLLTLWGGIRPAACTGSLNYD